MEIQGAIIRVLEYRIVKIPCSGDSEVGDSVVLVVEEFEHVGSDGSSVFGDPRYVPINPAVRASLQRPAPPSPSKKEGAKSQEYNFTQSLDPTDLLFLESTCTQTFQRQFTTFPQVISDSDWKIPAEQVKFLDGIRLMQIETFEYEAGSDVELSEDENEKAKRAKVTFPLTQTTATVNSQISPIKQATEAISQATIKLSATQAAMTQNNMQMPFTQVPLTQAPMTQASSQILLSQTQSPLRTEPVIFPETQQPSSNSTILGVTQSSPVRISKNMASSPIKNYEKSPVKMSSPMKDAMSSPMKDAMSSPMKDLMSSPMKSAMSSPIKSTMSPIKNVTSPIKNTLNTMSPVKSTSPVKNSATPIKFSSVNLNRENEFKSPFVSEVIKTTIEMAEIPSSPINSPVKKTSVVVSEVPVQKLPEPVIEYPDYSSW